MPEIVNYLYVFLVWGVKREKKGHTHEGLGLKGLV